MEKLNIDKLNSRIDRIMTSEEALSEIVPIEWTKDVFLIQGNGKVAQCLLLCMFLCKN